MPGPIESYETLSATREAKPQAERRREPAFAPVSGDDVVASAHETVSFEWVSKDLRPSRGGSIGIEFDGTHLAVVGVSGSGEKSRLDHLLLTTFDEPPTPETIANRLHAFVRYRRPQVQVVLTTPRAVFRHFLLPHVSTRQRENAAIWEGQKLVPFPLRSKECIYGLDFAAAPEHGWSTTLVAVPVEHAQPILDAVERLGWPLSSVSMTGTQQFVPNTTGEACAVVVWSTHRGCLSVFRRGQLVFHYDLGPMPAAPARMGEGLTEQNAAIWQKWVDSLGAAVGDALDFHLNVNPSMTPTHMRIYGLPLECSTLLTDWNARFPEGVMVGDATSLAGPGLPEGVVERLRLSSGAIMPALQAARNGAAIDLTPDDLRRARRNLHRERTARGAGILSVAGCLVWTALLGMQALQDHRDTVRLEKDIAQVQSSPVSQKLTEASARLTTARATLGGLRQRNAPLMPWLRAIVATLPSNAALTRLQVDTKSADGHVAIVAGFDGMLAPSETPYALVYRQWFDRLSGLAGSKNTTLVSERSMDWYGQPRSAFTLELHPELARVFPSGDAK
jgi:hypothetical protein